MNFPQGGIANTLTSERSERSEGENFGRRNNVTNTKCSVGDSSPAGSTGGAATTIAHVPVAATASGTCAIADGGAAASSPHKRRSKSPSSRASRSDTGSQLSRRSSHSAQRSLIDAPTGEIMSYNVHKWILYHQFQHDRKLIKHKISSLLKTAETGRTEGQAPGTQAEDVSDYWDTSISLKTSNSSRVKATSLSSSKLNGRSPLAPMETQALLILQCQFRLWLRLASMRRQAQFVGHSMDSNIGSVQNMIRRFYAVREVRHAEAGLSLSADLFTEFCTLMVAGVQILMYSKKHGTAVKRTIKFTDGMYACLCVCMLLHM